MRTASKAGSAGGIGNTVGDLLASQFRFSARLLETMSQRHTRSPSHQSCCDIPEPCWMPEKLGEVSSDACPGATANIQLLITNSDRTPRVITVTATGEAAGLISIQPTTLVLGPKERDIVSIILNVPSDANDRQEFDSILWVQGCREHYLRWIVIAGRPSRSCYQTVEVEDYTDFIHHWYDHFYCLRRCFHGQRKTFMRGAADRG
ncbi:MAG: hypothetical protein JSU77_06790 [Fidelibacterota bacterium]|nr:MAG: hypothetical protein JSU77_06790 [Candidatus Neomarinimicrobiota bacterium]